MKKKIEKKFSFSPAACYTSMQKLFKISLMISMLLKKNIRKDIPSGFLEELYSLSCPL